MHPEIIKLGPFALRSFGLFLALSFFAGLGLIKWRAKKYGTDFNRLVNLAFVVIISGILGARLFYVFSHWSEFAGHPLDIINPFQSGQVVGIAGLTLYGGVILAIVCGSIYLKAARLPFWPTFDIFAPAIAFGIFLTRIGCFLNGCCFGMPTALPWGVHFPADSIPAYYFPGATLHPAQLYASAYGLLLFLVLVPLDNRKKFYGSTFAWFLIGESIFRFLLEFVRYADPGTFFTLDGSRWTYNQLVAVGLFAGGVAMRIFLRKSFPLTVQKA